VTQKASQHTAARGVNGGIGAESTILADSTQPLGIKAHSGKRRKAGEPCGTPSKVDQRMERDSNPHTIYRTFLTFSPVSLRFSLLSFLF